MSERMNKERVREFLKELKEMINKLGIYEPGKNYELLEVRSIDWVIEMQEALDIAIDSLERNCCKYCYALCDSREDIKDDFVKEPTIKEIDGKLYVKLEGWKKVEPYNYCPNCGARMNDEVDDGSAN